MSTLRSRHNWSSSGCRDDQGRSCEGRSYPAMNLVGESGADTSDSLFITFMRSCISEDINIGSSLMSIFSRMSFSAPLAQYSVISVMLCRSALISTQAPMKLLTLSCLRSRINFISFITSRLMSFFLSNWSSLMRTMLRLYLAVWQNGPNTRESPGSCDKIVKV